MTDANTILFEMSSFSLNVILVIGSITTFFSSSVGLFQNDLKKIIAYSTCSQLGYMVFACGISNYSVGVFHLMNHAFVHIDWTNLRLLKKSFESGVKK